METYNKESGQESTPRFDNRSGRVWGGVVLVIIGSLFLADRMGADIPRWLFSWYMIPIGIGLYIGARHSFRPSGWIVPVLIGGFFLVNDILYDYDLKFYFWPVLLISVGLFMIFRPRRKSRWGNFSESIGVTSEDSLEAVSVFGGTKRSVITKDFKGGEITTIFGGTDLNFMQADINGTATIEITQVFGGTKLVVPPHWNVRSEIVCIFGGIDDKRKEPTDSTNKLLILKGTCVFGGIDIKSH